MGRIGFRAFMWFMAISVVFGAGWLAGGSMGTGTGQKAQYRQISECLPLPTQEALDACLAGERQ